MATLTSHRTPRSLGEDGRALWREMTAEGDYTGIKLRLLYQLAKTLERLDTLGQILDREGTTYPTPTGQIKARPEVAQEQAALRTIKSLTNELRAI